MKRKANKLIIGIIFLAGLSLLLYPFVANQWNNYRQSRLISEYESVVKDESRKGTINYEKEWERPLLSTSSEVVWKIGILILIFGTSTYPIISSVRMFRQDIYSSPGLSDAAAIAKESGRMLGRSDWLYASARSHSFS